MENVYSIELQDFTDGSVVCLDDKAVKPQVTVNRSCNYDSRGKSCRLCKVESFQTISQQREHFRSLPHLQALKGLVGEAEEVQATGETSGLSSDSESDFSPPAKFLVMEVSQVTSKLFDYRLPHYRFAIRRNDLTLKSFALYKALVDRFPGADATQRLESLIRDPCPWLIVMLTAGRFSAVVLAPATGDVIVEKSFSRYVTRQGQGKSQAKSDGSKGRPAQSAGAALRRANALKLEEEVRALLASWKNLINDCSVWWVYAPGHNKKVLCGKSQNCHLQSPLMDAELRSSRMASVFLTVKRVSRRESLQFYRKVTFMGRLQSGAIESGKGVSSILSEEINAEPLAQVERDLDPEPPFNPLSDVFDQNLATFKTLLSFIKKGKVASFLRTLADNPNFDINGCFLAESPQYPTLLHASAFRGKPKFVNLLLRPPYKADATLKNTRGRTAYELASDKATRDSFRVIMGLFPDLCSDWIGLARVPSPLYLNEAKQGPVKDKVVPAPSLHNLASRLSDLALSRSTSVPSLQRHRAMERSNAQGNLEEERRKRLEAIERRMKTD